MEEQNMKTFNTILRLFAASIVAVFALNSCSEDLMDNINRDNDHTKDVAAYFIIPEIELSTAQNIVGGDFNTYFACYNEQRVGTHNQLYNIEIRGGQVIAASTFNNVWASLYTNIRNCKIVLSKTAEDGPDEDDVVSRGIAEILLAYNAAVLTDMFGDAPFTQTSDKLGVPDVFFPTIDTQKSIYEKVNAYLDDAIEILDEAEAGDVAGVDFIYKGDAESWIKFAYGLKARYAARLAKVSGNETEAWNNVRTYIGKSFEDASEQAEFDEYDGNNINPVFDFQWSRDGISASESMLKKLTSRHDPRADHAYVGSGSWESISAADVVNPDSGLEQIAPNGNPVQSQYVYAYDYSTMADCAPVFLLSWQELCFLNAEAGYRLGDNSGAEEALKAGVEAAFINFQENVDYAVNAPNTQAYGGICPPGYYDEEGEFVERDPLTVVDADAYFDTYVKPLFTANPLKEIMIQKYIAMWNANGESTETYNDVRRIKAYETADIYELANTGKFPVRAPYGTDDTAANENVKKAYGDGQYVYTENVWWAGGTR